MKVASALQALILLVVVLGLGYVVVYVADGWADWVVFAMIVLAALGFFVAAHHRRYPYPTQKRSFRRDPDSRW